MAVLCLILGESGTGKSYSMKNMNPATTSIVNVQRKPLPFRSSFTRMKGTDKYSEILSSLQQSASSSIVIDDAQYLMGNEYMRSATTKFAKDETFEFYKKIGYNYWNLINTAGFLADDKIVYFLSHLDRDSLGNEKAKTIGKMLDEKICLEGMFTIVLKTVVQENHFYFATVNSGTDTVKAPTDMFASPLIPNDLKFVDDSIRAYYGIAIQNIAPATAGKEKQRAKSLV